MYKIAFVLNKRDDKYNLYESELFKYSDQVSIVTSGIQPVFKIEKLIGTLKEKLNLFKPQDMLVLSGPNILNVLAITYLFSRYDSINVLIHNNKEHKYVCKTINKWECSI